MSAFPSRMSAPTLDIDQSMAARRSGTAPASRPAAPAHPRPPRRGRPGSFAGFIAAILLLALAAAGYLWYASRTARNSPVPDDDAAVWTPDSLSDEAREAIVRFLSPDAPHFGALFGMITNSDVIRNNPAHADLAGRIAFAYLPDVGEVNADAGLVSVAEEGAVPQIRLFGGYVRKAQIIGAVIASKKFGTSLGVDSEALLVREYPLQAVRGGGKISVDDAVALLGRCGVRPALFGDASFLDEAGRIAGGVCLACIGHEVGHIAYHHVDNPSVSLETRRNCEREADSFAMSIAREERSYYGGEMERYMFVGAVYDAYLSALLDEVAIGTDDRGSDHPLSKERLLNLLRSKAELAEKYGIPVDVVERKISGGGVRSAK